MSTGLPAPKRVDIRAIRERFGLTQADIADELHVDKRTVRRWERGDAQPSPMAMAHLRSTQRRLTAQREDEGPGRGAAPVSSETPGKAQAGVESSLLPRRRLPSL